METNVTSIELLCQKLKYTCVNLGITFVVTIVTSCILVTYLNVLLKIVMGVFEMLKAKEDLNLT
jgi:hypothetical protein